MVCDRCDPRKIYRSERVETTIIPLPAIQVGPHEDFGWEIKKCRFCDQRYNVATLNDEFEKLLKSE